jgi:hypothetical protein
MAAGTSRRGLWVPGRMPWGRMVGSPAGAAARDRRAMPDATASGRQQDLVEGVTTARPFLVLTAPVCRIASPLTPSRRRSGIGR